MAITNKIILDKKKSISEKSPTFIIAEIGSNHNQSLKKAYKLIDVAAKAGADAVKFQFLNYDKMYLHDKINNDKFRSFFKKLELNRSWIKKLINHSKKKKIIFFFSSCFKDGLDIALKLKIKINKIASPQFYSYPQLLDRSLKSNIPTIASTGYSNNKEIIDVISKIKKKNKKNLIVLYCVSNYPTKISDINLDEIKFLKKKLKCIIGFSDHTMSKILPSLAVKYGAKVIEKHLTLSRKLNGSDHSFALEPKEFNEMVQYIKETEQLGQKQKKILKKIKKKFDLKCIYNKNYKKNETLKNIIFSGLRTRKIGINIKEHKILEKKYKLRFNRKKGELIKWKDIVKIS